MTQPAATRFHPLRQRGRHAAATLAAAAQAACAAVDDACTDRAIARRFAIASKTAVAAWFDAESGVAIALGDVLALPKELARGILVRALAHLDDGAGPSTRDALDSVTVDLGAAVRAYHDDMRDGREDRDDAHEANLTRIAAIALRGVAGIQQRRTAREAGK